MSKVERGHVARESVKEIQNTSYNSHFQNTARSLAKAPLCRDPRGRGQAREFSER